MTFKYEYDIAAAVVLVILLVYNYFIPQARNLEVRLFIISFVWIYKQYCRCFEWNGSIHIF